MPPGAAPSDPRIAAVLNRYWGFDTLRPLQSESIAATLAGRDSLTVLPTGGGKSLCYQLPPLVTDRLTLVVSPLISLIQDQLHHLAQASVRAAALGSEQDGAGVGHGDIFDDLYSPQPQLKCLFVTPEKVARSHKLIRMLEHLERNGRLARIVVDEARLFLLFSSLFSTNPRCRRTACRSGATTSEKARHLDP